MPPIVRRSELTDDVEKMKGSRRGVVSVVVAVLLLGGLGAGGFFAYKRFKGGPKPDPSYGALFGCMAGPPLAEGENLDGRLRSIGAALGDDKGDFPKRCDDELSAFYESLGSEKKTSAVREILEVEANCAKTCSAEGLMRKLPLVHDVVTAAKITPEGAGDYKDPPKMLTGTPLPASVFKEIVPGTVSLQGMTTIGDGRTALLYRDPVGTLHACEIEPDGAKPVHCAPVILPIRPATARLVEGRSKTTISGVTAMGETPDKTTSGVFDAWTAVETGDDVKTVSFASDRPRLPAASATWFEAELEGTKIHLYRTKNNVLRMDRGTDPPKLVLDAPDSGGPSTGEPIAFVGKKKAVVVFTAKQGVAALVVSSDGSVASAK